MGFIKTSIPDLLIFEPQVFEDERGYFFESFNQETFQKELDYNIVFVQDNQAKSNRGVLRGLHYQTGENAQAKLVRVLSGEVLDVVVDCRPYSETYGQHESVVLSQQNKRQLFVPRGFAHGYIVLSETAEFFYKCDNLYNKASEGGIVFNDESLKIDWQFDLTKATVSKKDEVLPTFGNHIPAL